MKDSRQVVFKDLNVSYNDYLKRVAEHTTEIYAGGLYFNFFNGRSDFLLVKDDQDGLNKKVWHKIPGGVSEGVANDAFYLYSLKTELEKMKYTKAIIGQILRIEESKIKTRNIAERTLMLEFVEETGYFPTNFIYGMDAYRYNTTTLRHDLLQVYFSVTSIISPYSKSLEHPIQNIAQVRTAEAIDKDVQEMRVVVKIEDLIKTLGPKTHKEAAKILCGKQAHYWLKKSENAFDAVARDNYMQLSKRFGYASM